MRISLLFIIVMIAFSCQKEFITPYGTIKGLPAQSSTCVYDSQITTQTPPDTLEWVEVLRWKDSSNYVLPLGFEFRYDFITLDTVIAILDGFEMEMTWTRTPSGFQGFNILHTTEHPSHDFLMINLLIEGSLARLDIIDATFGQSVYFLVHKSLTDGCEDIELDFCPPDYCDIDLNTMTCI